MYFYSTILNPPSVQFSSVAQSCPTLCDPMNRRTPGPLFITIFRSSLRLTSIESVMPSSHLILCPPLFLLPSILPSIRVFPNESVLRIRWAKYWNFSFSISPSNEYSVLVSLGWTHWIPLQSKGLSRVFSNTTVQWALRAAVSAWDLLKEVAIIFITCTIVWPLVKQQGGGNTPTPQKKIGLNIY